MAPTVALEKSLQLRKAEGAQQYGLPVLLCLALQVPLPDPHNIHPMQIFWQHVQGLKDCTNQYDFCQYYATEYSFSSFSNIPALHPPILAQCH